MNILRITRRVLTVVLVAGALSAPVAAAAPFEERFPSLADRETPVVPPASVLDASSAPSVGLGTAPAVESPTASPSGGFDWGDATIGAAAMLAITAIAAGGAVELSRRRRPRPTVA